MTKDEALKLALEALEMFCEHGAILRPIETRDAIKEALAQREQEPVAWRAKNFYENQEGWFYAEWHQDGLTPQVAELLYTTPPQRKPLTDEEIQDLLMPVRISGDGYYLRIARAIEAAHGIKGEA